MAELARWGVKRLGRPHRGQTFRPAWAMFPLSYMADPAAARGVHETYEFQIEDERFHLCVADGTVEPRAGGADQPDLILTMDRNTIRDLLSGVLDPSEAVSTQRVTVEGSPQAFQRAVAILAGQPD
jgi:putative sterol carrier protein